MTRKHAVRLISVLAMTGFCSCGDVTVNNPTSDPADGSGGNTPPPASPSTNAGPTKTIIEGSIISAFQITVDGTTYQDSEDFYSSEIGRLPEKVAAAGYAGWSATFEAVLGFADLTRSMLVYVAPAGNYGYTALSAVSLDGRFRIELPSNGRDDSYNIRAVKRVNILLSKDAQSVKFCYNFSAIEKNLKVSELSKPVILDDFQTRLTKYACSVQEKDAGTTIPVMGQSPVQDL